MRIVTATDARQTISLGKVPGEIKDIPFQDGQTVRELFAAANIEINGAEIQCNGAVVGLDHRPAPGDSILAMTRVRGN